MRPVLKFVLLLGATCVGLCQRGRLELVRQGAGSAERGAL